MPSDGGCSLLPYTLSIANAVNLRLEIMRYMSCTEHFHAYEPDNSKNQSSLHRISTVNTHDLMHRAAQADGIGQTCDGRD